jgi:hypothetical protein
MRVTTIRKTLARQLVSQIGGWFADEGNDGLGGSMACPCCGARIHADLPREHWGKPAVRKQQALIRAIRAAVVDHLIDFYEDSACPHTRCRPRHEVGQPVEPA